ncbi:MAG: hypothetical protein WDN27_05555 [Candidatus Saccharibacteria bacterium]
MSAMKRRHRPLDAAKDAAKKPIEGIKKPIQGFRKFVSRRPAIEEVVHETTSGGVIFRRNAKSNDLEILLIRDAKNRWTIPKGHVERARSPRTRQPAKLPRRPACRK